VNLISRVDTAEQRIVSQPRLLEPQRREVEGSNPVCQWTTTLPDDFVKEQAIRLQVFYAAGVCLWLLNFIMDISVAPNGDRGPYRSEIELAAAAIAAGACLYIRFGRTNYRAKIRFGVAAIVPHALALAVLNSWAPQPTTMRPISPITVLILFFGMLAPGGPKRVLAAGLIAASMDPLGVWVAHLRGQVTPSPMQTFVLFYPNYVCAVLAVAPSRILLRLGSHVRAARALGNYELVEQLGEGGMGEVWLARHRLLARSAAVKLIRPEMLNDDKGEQAATLGRFEREAQATAALTSPHTIRLFDFGVTSDGTFYYVMELLSGRDLESLVRNFGPLPPGRVIHLIRQICSSLAEAHALGLIHRDIKPANIYLCRVGLEYDFAKVLDFGLVKRESQHGQTTVNGEAVVAGTPGYMAPEVIVGQTDIDRRVDVYALGCLAYFLLTGERVFCGSNQMSMLIQHVQAQPMPPSHRSELEIPPEVDELVMACLRREPSERPANAGALLEMANTCKTHDVWDQTKAKKWWEAHLPDLAAPAMQNQEATV